MRVDYRPLFVTLLACGMTPAELRKKTGLSSATFTKLRKNEPVNVETLVKCAEALKVYEVEKLVRFY